MTIESWKYRDPQVIIEQLQNAEKIAARRREKRRTKRARRHAEQVRLAMKGK